MQLKEFPNPKWKKKNINLVRIAEKAMLQNIKISNLINNFIKFLLKLITKK